MTLEEIRQECRNSLSDHPLTSTLTLAVNSSEESFSVTDGTTFKVDGYLEIDSEICKVHSISEEKIGVRRGVRGTSAASHVINSVITADPLFTNSEIDAKINEALQAIYPKIYRKITTGDGDYIADGSRFLDISDLEPIAPKGIAVVEVEIEDAVEAGQYVWVEKRGWRETPGMLQFELAPEAGRKIRLTYAAYWEILEDDSDETTLPKEIQPIVVYYVAGKLGERQLHARLRYEGYSIEADPSKVTASDVLGIAGYDLYKFETMLAAKAMIPLGYGWQARRTRRRT